MELSFQTVMSQIMLGLNNGVFYAILSLGLAVIFGLLNIVNFAHGALYMLGAYVALLGYTTLGPLIGMPDFHLNYWAALIVAPLIVGALGIVTLMPSSAVMLGMRTSGVLPMVSAMLS